MQDHTKPIHDTIDPSDDGLTSGFTESIDQERAVDSMSEEKGFGNVQEYYVSKSGPTRLFTATRYGKRYVLKCLKTDYLLTPVYQQAIVKEFEIGLLLEHPYICRTLAMEQLAGMGRTIVMEQVDGDTLQTLLSEKRLSPDLALRIASQTMDALDYMHSKQITHRDLKPSNIMVTHRGKNVKIIDFGLSDSDLFGVLKMPAGTYRYLAPEQLLQGAVADLLCHHLLARHGDGGHGGGYGQQAVAQDGTDMHREGCLAAPREHRGAAQAPGRGQTPQAHRFLPRRARHGPGRNGGSLALRAQPPGCRGSRRQGADRRPPGDSPRRQPGHRLPSMG